MSPLEYEVTLPPDARWARVKILCKHHPDQVIAEWSTFDGRQAIVRYSEGSRDEFVGWVPDVQTRRQMEETGADVVLSTAVAAPDPGDVPHWRHMLACDKPSCPYRPLLRQERAMDLDKLVLTLWAEGIAEHVVVDLESLWPRKR